MYVNFFTPINNYFSNLFWPIKSSEFSKFVLMAMLMFTILLNQNIVRVVKDSLITTLIGPEIISFVKFWCETPISILFAIIYSKLCNMMSTEQVFRVVVTFFLSFFIIFAFIFYPYQSFFHPNSSLIEHYVELQPNLKWFIVAWGKWTLVLFYVISSLWPMVIFSLLFWQLANKTTKNDEAKRFYPFFNLFGQSNLLISGLLIAYFADEKHFLFALYSNLEDTTETLLKSTTTVISIIGLIILCLQYFIDKTIINNNKNINYENSRNILKLGLWASFKMVFTSKYLGLIFLLIFCYNITVNLIEGLWLSKVKDVYPSIQSFMSYQGNVLFWIGIFTLFASFITSTLIRKFKWSTVAIITPLTFIILGMIFFTSVIIENKLEFIFIGFSYSVPVMIAFIGGLQEVFGKSMKYSLFDTTKEMSYIPLSDEVKTKGKAAVDVAGAKIGESVGTMIPFLAFIILPGIKYDDIATFLMAIFSIVCLIWIFAVKALAREYNRILNLH